MYLQKLFTYIICRAGNEYQRQDVKAKQNALLICHPTVYKALAGQFTAQLLTVVKL